MWYFKNSVVCLRIHKIEGATPSIYITFHRDGWCK